MKSLNKKGFTLIELLAVIIVLAVVTLLAVQAVLPQVEKARKNSFVTEANSAIEAAKQWYADKLLTSPSDVSGNVVCVKISTLKDNGFYEVSRDGYLGTVKIDKSGTQTVYKILITNGSYQTKTEHRGKLTTSETTGTGATVVAVGSDGATTVTEPTSGCN